MSYTALYRKWRPQTFEDVKGQDPIVTTLKNQVCSGRIGHAYLFCGTRGTGKTSVAKIFARAVNCEAPVNGSPCGKCASCLQIAAGNSLNVMEIDAASNNGVENIREIREQVQYPPTEGKYRVYIIDEVHMLSTGAFNALLKTLEEPPSYVIFILATTEVHRIPITVLSRCQRYDFRRITADTITERLKELTAAEQMPVEERALRYLAKAGDGSMRDALSLLDQCAAFHFGETLTYEHVLDVLGAVDHQVFRELFQAIRKDDVKGCIQTLEEMVVQGRELSQFVVDFIWYLRNLLLIKTAEDAEELFDMSADNLALLKEDANPDSFRFVQPDPLRQPETGADRGGAHPPCAARDGRGFGLYPGTPGKAGRKGGARSFDGAWERWSGAVSFRGNGILWLWRYDGGPRGGGGAFGKSAGGGERTADGAGTESCAASKGAARGSESDPKRVGKDRPQHGNVHTSQFSGNRCGAGGRQLPLHRVPG